MKSKYAAILLVSTTMAISSVGTSAIVYAEPQAMEQPDEMMQEMPDSEAPDGEMPDFQNGEAPDGQAPDFQNGEAPDGQAPDFQNGEAPDGETPDFQNGEAPDGEAPNGEMPMMPNGEMPEGKNFVKVTAIENGSVTVEIGGMPALNEEQEAVEHETKSYDLTGAEILKETEPGKTESATEADITADSMLEITLNEDGSVKTVTIKAMPENLPNGQMPQGEMPEGKNFVKVTAVDDNLVTVEINGMQPEEQDQKNAAETTSYDLSSAEILKESAPGKTEAAAVTDITADSMLEVELNEDGSVKTVIIKARPENMPGEQAGPSSLQNAQETTAQS